MVSAMIAAKTAKVSQRCCAGTAASESAYAGAANVQNAAHAPRPGATTVPLSALPWHHPHRFHREVAWLRAHATLPSVRIALPTTDREHEWQLLLLLFHTLHGRLGKWAVGFRWDLGAN